MQKLKKGKVKLTSLAAVALAMVMGTGLVAGTAFVSADDSASTTTSSLTKYYTDYNSMEDAKKAAEDLNRQIVGEGASLLKNKDEALPMKGSEWVSVFGVKADNLVGASDSAGAWSSDSGGSDETIADSLTHAGFKVNPTLKAFYQQDSSGIGAEVTDFPGTVDSSTKLYNDAAFIVLSREGGEGSDASRVTKQTVDEDDDHVALYTDEEGKTYKHYLMLTDEEEALIEYVTARFNKVIVITNTSNPMELGDLENNDKISAILHIGRRRRGHRTQVPRLGSRGIHDTRHDSRLHRPHRSQNGQALRQPYNVDIQLHNDSINARRTGHNQRAGRQRRNGHGNSVHMDRDGLLRRRRHSARVLYR